MPGIEMDRASGPAITAPPRGPMGPPTAGARGGQGHEASKGELIGDQDRQTIAIVKR